MTEKTEHAQEALIPIEKLHLSGDTHNLLKNARIKTVDDLLNTERTTGLLRVRNLGKKHYLEIQNALAETGIALTQDKLAPKAALGIADVETPTLPVPAVPLPGGHSPSLKTVVFVDFEHWYVALKGIHQRKPNLGAWFDDLSQRGKLLEVTFFGDFSDTGGMREEINNIRLFSNRIIETKNVSPHAKKSFTDFIMLDNIYQKIISSPEIEQVILFTGDGDFCSVAAYLRHFCAKVVGVYGVDGAISNQLEVTAHWCERLPFSAEPHFECRRAILKNLKYAQTHSKSPTFRPTVRLVAEHYALYEDAVEAELRLLLEEGIVYTMPERSRRDYTVMLNILKVRWDLVEDLM